ncbi:hypothetical protein MMC29_007927 [Sticta canariensis]|nr:hypothetical protein [Sticta canariensis]
MKASHERSCRMCSVVYRGIAAMRPDALEGERRLCWAINVDHVAVTDRFAQSGYQKLRFYASKGSPEPWATLGPGPNWNRDFASEECFRQIDAWLYECTSKHTHPTCRLPSAMLLPRRVIDVGLDRTQGTSGTNEERSSQGDGFQRLRLYESGGECARYIALSHCWGPQQNFTTTRATYEERKLAIKYAVLPKTFRDAIFVARRVKIQYLWIDSLCIIQDDPADWEQQSSEMGSIYANAYFTLAASSSSSDQDGFLGERPDTYCGRMLSCQDDSTHFNVRVHRDFHTNRTLGKLGLILGPLSNRAWTLQEDILARRTIFYQDGELAWECCSKLNCECGEANHWAGSGYSLSTTQSSSNQIQHRSQYAKPLTEGRSETDLYRDWRHIISEYTSRKLTKESDRFPALSGVASKLQAFTQDTYLGGLWKNDLLKSLLWQTESPLPLSSAYRAPSFSWASVSGSVVYNITPLHHTITPSPEPSPSSEASISLLDAKCTTRGLNPWGEVSDGFIKLRGFVEDTLLTKSGPEVYLGSYPPEPGYAASLFNPDTFLIKAEVPLLSGVLMTTVQRTSSKRETIDFEAPVKRLFLAAVGERYYFLILGVARMKADAYERLGLYDCSTDGGTNLSVLASARIADVLIV